MKKIALVWIFASMTYLSHSTVSGQTTRQFVKFYGGYDGRRLSEDRELNSIADALPLLIEIDVPQGSVLPGENFPIRLKITNPNEVVVYLWNVGHKQPVLYIAANDGDFLRFARRAHSSDVLAPVLGAGESATVTFPMFAIGLVQKYLDPNGGFTLRLKAGGIVRAYVLDGREENPVPFVWDSSEAEFEVRVPTEHERAAFEALVDWEGQDWGAEPRTLEDRARQEIEFYRRFLEEYGDTAYANRVRVFLLQELRDPIQKTVHQQVYEGQKMGASSLFPLYLKTVDKLLDAGLPYAAAVDRAALENLVMAGRWDTFIGAVQRLLAFDPSEHTLDKTFARLASEFSVVRRLEGKAYGPTPAMSDRAVLAILDCIERVLQWDGYRAVVCEKRTFDLLQDEQRWDLLKRTAKTALDVAHRTRELKAPPELRFQPVRERDITSAIEGLRLAEENLAATRDTGSK